MPNYDDLFAPQSDQREDTPFDREAWAAKKQADYLKRSLITFRPRPVIPMREHRY